MQSSRRNAISLRGHLDGRLIAECGAATHPAIQVLGAAAHRRSHRPTANIGGDPGAGGAHSRRGVPRPSPTASAAPRQTLIGTTVVRILWAVGLRRPRLRAINPRPTRPQQPSVQKRPQHPSLRHHVHPRRRKNRRYAETTQGSVTPEMLATSIAPVEFHWRTLTTVTHPAPSPCIRG